MRVLVACEYSGTVRDAFKALGHYAMSCDLLPTDVDGEHYTGDVFDIINEGWDLMIAHPPCTHLAVSGAKWFKDKQQEQAEALEFVQRLMDAPIEKSVSKTLYLSSLRAYANLTRSYSPTSSATWSKRKLACG